MSNYRLSLIFFILLEGGIYFLLKESTVYILIVLLLYMTLLLVFSMNLRFNFFLKAYSNAKEGYVLVGFDDGPDPKMTLKILDVLKEYNAKAIFFLIGEKAKKHPEIVRRIAKEGHLIGGHSMNHRNNFAFLSRSKVEEEIMGGINSVEEITQKEINLFRPPFGLSNPVIANVITKNN